jgi:hypothetical protein
MVCTVGAIGGLPVRRFGLFEAEQAVFILAINFHTIPPIFRVPGDEDRFFERLRKRQIALS